MRESRKDVLSKKSPQAILIAHRLLTYDLLQPIRVGVGTGWKRGIGELEKSRNQSANDSVMVRMPCGRNRAKNLRRRTPGNPFPLEHLSDGRIVHGAYDGFCHFDWEVQIANLPGKNGHPSPLGARLDFQDGLRGLRDHIAFSGFSEKDAPIGQSMNEVETKLPCVLRHASPAPFCERGTIHRQNDDLLPFMWRIL